MTANAPNKKVSKPSKPKCKYIGMCPIFNEHEADLDHSSELAFLVRWLQAHKEYLKTYPPKDPLYDPYGNCPQLSGNRLCEVGIR